MTTQTRNLLIVIGILIAVAIVVLSTGPAIIEMGPERNGRTPSVVQMGQMDDMLALADLNFDMPQFQGITRWWNTPDDAPLTPESLRGKVVMVKFWTYSCINCIRTYPFIKRWNELYEDDGFVLVGVHTPEFAFEAKPENVDQKIRENGFTFPVALDPDYRTWRSYNNRFWPATYLFDVDGNLRYTHFGEGEYDVTEAAIKTLLKEGGMTVTAEDMPMPEEFTGFGMIKTRETYFGYDRGENLANTFEVKVNTNAEYELKNVGINQWSIGGAWRIEDERAVSFGPGATHRMSVQAPRYNIVLDAPEGVTAKVRVTVDGAPLLPEFRTEDISVEDDEDIIYVSDPRLYQIINIPNADRHVVEIEVLEGEVRFYAATFG